MKFPPGVHKLTRVPKGNDVNGKVWRDVDVTLPDGRIIRGRYESNRGAFVYFAIENQHYRAFTERFLTQDPSGSVSFMLREEEKHETS